jgi:hypothetical protein
VTFTEAAIISIVVCAISVSWLLGYLRPNLKNDQKTSVTRLDELDDLRWNDWTPSTGWPPVTCWHGCLRLHRDDWWTAYVYHACWPGCANLHRSDWWRAYVDLPDQRPESLPRPAIDTSVVRADPVT